MAQTSNTLSKKLGHGNGILANVRGRFNWSAQRDSENAEIMRWLSPLEPDTRHLSVQGSRLKGVGDWFLKTREFREWSGDKGGAHNAVLFCSGNPGVGKTYLK